MVRKKVISENIKKYNESRKINYTETHKECSCCHKMKLHNEFHRDSNPYKLAYYCKECANYKSKEFYKSYKDTKDYKLKAKNHYCKIKWGISLIEYEELLAKQNFVCAICGVKLPTSGPFTHLDHCHKTGKKRAFLCTNCNRGLGHFQDSEGLLDKAKSYLEYHRKENFR